MMKSVLFAIMVAAVGAAGPAACIGDGGDELAGEDELELGRNDERRPDLIECRNDRPCPRGSYCEPGLDVCFTPSRCYVDGRPSDEFCERTYGDDFVCYEYAPGSHHCVPTE